MKVQIEAPHIIEAINKSLKELYGVDTVSGLPMFKVVWSEDEYEKRFGTFDDITPAGIFIRTVTEVREMPKYKQWIQEKHILERLVVVPDYQQKELAGAKISYEPLITFFKTNKYTGKHDYVAPTLEQCKFIIDSTLAAQIVAKMMIMGNESPDRLPTARYTDPEEGSQEQYIATRRAGIDKIVEELYGDETGLLGATLSRNQGGGEAIIVPHKQFGDK